MKLINIQEFMDHITLGRRTKKQKEQPKGCSFNELTDYHHM